jgi:hypothetical protein
MIEDDVPETHHEEFVPNFYAPPPRASAADLAIVSRRTGSPEELQNEILETKARLQERSAALFAESEALAEPVAPPPVYAKPGFYRKSANQTESETSPNVELTGVTPEPEPEAKPDPEPAPSVIASGPAIRIRISSPTDGVYKNG